MQLFNHLQLFEKLSTFLVIYTTLTRTTIHTSKKPAFPGLNMKSVFHFLYIQKLSLPLDNTCATPTTMLLCIKKMSPCCNICKFRIFKLRAVLSSTKNSARILAFFHGMHIQYFFLLRITGRKVFSQGFHTTLLYP